MIYLKKFNESIKYDFIKGTYTINKDGSIDIDGSVNLYRRGIKPPVTFNNVSGEFNCCYNELTSLNGWCPKYVGGNFNCSYNNLITLEGSPTYVGGEFNCFDNKLTDLEHSPKYVNSLFCHRNNILNFKGVGEIESELYIGSNPINEIFRLCPTKEFIKYLNEFRPIRGKTILGKRLQECLYMCDKPYIDLNKVNFLHYTLLE